MLDSLEPVPAGPPAGPRGPFVGDFFIPTASPRSLRAPSLFDNEPDDRGNPICPVCRQGIQPGEAVARWRTFLVHVTCLRAARKRGEDEP